MIVGVVVGLGSLFGFVVVGIVVVVVVVGIVVVRMGFGFVLGCSFF